MTTTEFLRTLRCPPGVLVAWSPINQAYLVVFGRDLDGPVLRVFGGYDRRDAVKQYVEQELGGAS